MSSYDQLSSTVEDIVTQAILADLRCVSSGSAGWIVENQDNPSTVRYIESQVGTWGSSEKSVTLNWSDGAVTSAAGPGDGSDESTIFLQVKSKWQKAIPPLFDKFLDMPEPSKFTDESTNLNTTCETLNGGGFKIGDTKFEGSDLTYKLWQVGSSVETAKLTDWSGSAATTFRDQYIKTWPANLTNQFAASCLIKLNIDREEAMWTKAREQIALTADHAVAAMKGAEGTKPDSGVVLAIFGAVSALASFALPVAGQVTLAAIGGALSIADAASNKPDKKTMEFGADTPDAVFTKMDTGLLDFANEIWDAEYAIYTDLKALQDKLHARTAFIGTGADDLVGSTDPADVGARGDQFETGEIANLRSFAQVCIDASGDARTAASACTIASPSSTRTRAAGLGYGFDGAADQYSNCVSMLQDIIADNGIVIGDAGVQLDAAANTYSDTDTDSQNQMQNRTGDLTDMRKDDQDMPAPPPPPLPRHGPMPI